MSQFPVHEELNVIEGHTIFKSEDWWKAVVLYDGFGGPEVAVYLWKSQGGEWRRKQKLTPDPGEEWEETKETVDAYLTQQAASS